MPMRGRVIVESPKTSISIGRAGFLLCHTPEYDTFAAGHAPFFAVVSAVDVECVVSLCVLLHVTRYS